MENWNTWPITLWTIYDLQLNACYWVQFYDQGRGTCFVFFPIHMDLSAHVSYLYIIFFIEPRTQKNWKQTQNHIPSLMIPNLQPYKSSIWLCIQCCKNVVLEVLQPRPRNTHQIYQASTIVSNHKALVHKVNFFMKLQNETYINTIWRSQNLFILEYKNFI
jgi:hypothetical protein